MRGTASALPASKSIANRVLIMKALAKSESALHNLSDANDTQLMLRLVNSPETEIDVEDAGTTMRFLTAYFSITNQKKILTGTARMKERPIGILVNALRSLGVDIAYLEKDGYPPIRINGFSSQKTNAISIRGDVSSQFISALMMVAPVLPQGLTLTLEGKIGSRPYIEMTASLMRHFGTTAEFAGNTISIKPQTYRAAEFTVESDWSGASYWFSFVALAKEADVVLPRLSLQSLQGDRAIADMTALGVKAELVNGELRLTKASGAKEISWDFTHCPDLAQTVAVICAAKGIKGNFTGLESLRIKETDRIAALQNELRKIGADLREDDSTHWTLLPSTKLPSSASFQTYKDHRMAMAFAPLATLMNVEIENPSVVRKSYPRFWDDVRSFGFQIEVR
ncbi:3-phosphoshikimate 1-carboxyvinyltransferase [Fulvivirgaceae bacterium PWU4]|uniref:3-phosphoshikimate 1-carboxyvinyltransferase n=1 Tax=Chryseosolibacter histidini TaxID=2782349 RepID=A0AAP2DJ97_9BACT|nr:3-phosphoshikimate 1-carboxyvinyltransferase [Chryseosolibacter histidini]